MLTRSAAKTFANALYMRITVGTRATGRSRVRLKALGGSFPFPLEIVDEFGDIMSSRADAGLLLRGPGSLAVFIGRSKLKSEPERLDFMVLDARVVIGKTGALAGSFKAYEISTVNEFFREFSAAVKSTSHRKTEGVEWH